MRPDRVHLEAAKIIGHLSCPIGEFWDRARPLPDVDKYRLEAAVHDLTVWSLRQPPTLKLELTAAAKKILRVVLGPPPDDPAYAHWWERRMLSVEQMRAEGKEPRWASELPSDLATDKKPPPRESKKAPKRTAKKPAGKSRR